MTGTHLLAPHWSQFVLPLGAPAQQPLKTPVAAGVDSQFPGAGARGFDAPTASHPGSHSPSAEIIAHILETHHRALRDQLQRIQSLLDATAGQSGPRTDRQRRLALHFAQFQRDAGDCLRAESEELFPSLQPTARTLLGESARAIERLHAHSLVTLWRLLDVARGAGADDREEQALVVELSALSEEHYQHLFEVECLLLPRFVSRRASRRAT
jgi:hypothetical protein